MALRKKKDSSIVKALNLVKEKQCHAIISGGSTGAFLKFSTRVKNKAKYLLSINNISVQPPKTIKKCNKSKKKLF